VLLEILVQGLLRSKAFPVVQIEEVRPHTPLEAECYNNSAKNSERDRHKTLSRVIQIHVQRDGHYYTVSQKNCANLYFASCLSNIHRF